ncbi:hypothetical protein [Rhizobium rhizogenes]|jgi:hypothetical protein|uniref:hypothetical protein n=1 Tax=Rhizobium rhizogenes TaxID=359 RepID=UPI0006471DC2|nr:hypothetical protein [Rhizobium rhizogenes]
MTKDKKPSRSAPRDKVVTSPIGGRKAAKFALVEGLTMNADSKSLARKLTASGLKGDAYRSEIIKAFKKG